MAEKYSADLKSADAGQRTRIRNDLESKGLSPEFSTKVASRLASIVQGLSPAEYAVALDTAAIAYDIQLEEVEAMAEAGRKLDEIQRMMQGFSAELRKLEEGLRTLSAYAQRMRSQTTGDSGGTLH